MNKQEFIASRIKTEDMSDTHEDFVNGDPSLENAVAYIYDDSWFIQVMEDGRYFSIAGTDDIISECLEEVENWLWPRANAACGYFDE